MSAAVLPLSASLQAKRDDALQSAERSVHHALAL
jgi:hypothetical protein